MLLYYAEIMLLQRVTPLNYDLDRSATPLNVGELNGYDGHAHGNEPCNP